MNNHSDKVIQYYNDTENDYKIMWHAKLQGPPALHFGYYDEKATKHADALYRVNEILADWAEVKSGDTVLDAGCGLGNAVIWLANTRKANATGISIVEQQINRAKEYAQEAGATNADFIHADYLKTPFPDASFDVVWCIESVCHALDKSLFYKEAFRILKSGGRLVMADSFRGGRPMSAANEKLLKQAFSGWEIHDIDTTEEHIQHAKQAGFTSVETKDVSDKVWVSYKNIRELTGIFILLAYVIKFLRIINQVRLNNVKSAYKQSEALKNHAFRYVHLLAVKTL
jgi:tocopherol O-methyltransferase